MEVKLENLNLIEQMSNELKFIIHHIETMNEQRWLSVKDISRYLSYSRDRIYKLKDDVFIEGIHYHKKQGKILFDRWEIDRWVISNTTNAEEKVSQILNDLV